MSENKKRVRQSFSHEESTELLDLYEKARTGGNKPVGWIPPIGVLKEWATMIARGKPTSKHRYKVYLNFFKQQSGKATMADESDSDDASSSGTE